MNSLDTFLTTGVVEADDKLVDATGSMKQLREADDSLCVPSFTIDAVSSQAVASEHGCSTEMHLKVRRDGEREFVVNENGNDPHALVECFRKAFDDLQCLDLRRFRIEQTEDGATVRVVIGTQDDVLYLGSATADHQLTATRNAIVDCVECHLRQAIPV